MNAWTNAVLKDWIDPDDPHRRAIRLEQLKLAARNSDASLAQMPLMAAAIAGGLALWAPWTNMAAWYVAIVAASLLSRRFLKSYLSPTLDVADLRRLSLRFAAANSLQMIVFVAVSPLAWPVGEPMGQALVQLILAASMASVASITGASRLIFVTDIIPTALVTIIVPIAFDGWVGVPMAVLSALFAVAMIENAKGSYDMTEKALTLNDANTALIGDLRAASRAKSEFLANMSHELRTPLNAILGFSEVMKDEVMGPMGNKTYKSYAADIFGSGTLLLSLVNDILDLAKVESGTLELADDIFSMDDIARTAVSLFRMQAATAGITLVTDVAPEITVRWDLRAAKQIAINLMSNAIKFTPPGGTVTVSSRLQDDGGCFVTVRDTGCGIAPEYHEKIFESFGQGRHDVAIDHKGTGLGLAIVSGLVQMHGGRVTLESAVGKGTAITIIVPPERVLAHEAAKAAA